MSSSSKGSMMLCSSAEERIALWNTLEEHVLNDAEIISIARLKEACGLSDAEVASALWECDGFIQKTFPPLAIRYVKFRELLGEFNLGCIASIKNLLFMVGIKKHKGFTDKIDITDACYVKKIHAVQWADKKDIPISEVHGLTARTIEYIRAELQDAQHHQQITNEDGVNLKVPKIKKRVSTFGVEKAQVKNTCEENGEAQFYIDEMRRRGVSDGDIARALRQVGGSTAVIGCLLFSDSESVDSARSKVKYLIGKTGSK